MPDGDGAHRGLRASLWAGAAFDAAFGVPLAVAPEWLARTVGAPPAAGIVYRLAGVLLLMLAASHALAAAAPDRYFGNVLVAILGRLLGGGLLAIGGLAGGEPPVVLVAGLADLALAGSHALLGRRLLAAHAPARRE